MSKPKEIQHRVFGALTLVDGFYWSGRATVAGLREVELKIDRDDGSPPTMAQEQAYQQSVAALPGLLNDVASAILKYVREEIRPLAEQMFDEDEVEELLPAQMDRAWLEAQLSQPRIIVPHEPQAATHTPDIAFFWECSWDPEHGFAVWIRDQRPVHVTQQVDYW